MMRHDLSIGIYLHPKMDTISVMKFSQYIELKFLEWQQEQGGRKTVKEFAKYLGVAQSTISMWWNNEEREPDGEYLRKIAEKFGIEVYDILGKPRPDEDLLYLQSVWETLPSEERRAIRERVKKYASKNKK